jgi:hypothetical protein
MLGLIAPFSRASPHIRYMQRLQSCRMVSYPDLWLPRVLGNTLHLLRCLLTFVNDVKTRKRLNLVYRILQVTSFKIKWGNVKSESDVSNHKVPVPQAVNSFGMCSVVLQRRQETRICFTVSSKMYQRPGLCFTVTSQMEAYQWPGLSITVTWMMCQKPVLCFTATSQMEAYQRPDYIFQPRHRWRPTNDQDYVLQSREWCAWNQGSVLQSPQRCTWNWDCVSQSRKRRYPRNYIKLMW